MRLDRALHARGLARSRTHAQALIAEKSVLVDGNVVTKRAFEVEHQQLELAADADHYVSRGAHKLVGALASFAPAGLVVTGRECMDAGASTGGFTQVLLEDDAASVLAVDVGHDQLSPAIARDPRVDAREGINVRDFVPPSDAARVEFLVADLSFISLRHVLPGLAAWLRPGADALLMVKPQFEVGAGGLGKGGVVRSADARAGAVASVAQSAREADLHLFDVARSRLSGPRGNVEYFIWCGKPWQAEQAPSGQQDTRPRLDEESLARAIDREVKGEV